MAAPRAAISLQGVALHANFTPEEPDALTLPLLSGAMHYWRLAPASWREAVRAIKELGLPIVETYVPWAVHEVQKGEFDFGSLNPRNDLGAFLDIVAEAGLYAFLRPGPHINAEMTRFGLPDRIIHDPAMQAKTPRGNAAILTFPPKMFPVPSYVSEAFFEASAQWLEAVAEIIAPRLYPRGPVVLLQVDNEAGFYFRNGPHCVDYHPDGLPLWRAHLQARHGSLEAVARAHQRPYRTWEEVERPEGFDVSAAPRAELARQLDWASHQELMLANAVGRLHKIMAQHGLTQVPTVHNLSLGDAGIPASVPSMEAAVDLVGFDYYHSRRALPTVKRRTLYLSGTTGGRAYAPELGVGAPPWFTPLTPQDSLFVAMSAAAYGLRGFNLYMAIDRDRWFGAPIDAKGVPREIASRYRAFIEALKETQFHTLERDVHVAIEWPREYAQLTRATHTLGALSPSAVELATGSPAALCRGDDFGFEVPIQIAWWDWLEALAGALTSLNIPYEYVDSEAPLDRLRRYDALFSPTFEFAAKARVERLLALREEGAIDVQFGPKSPHLDEAMQQLSPTLDPQNPEEDVQALLQHWMRRFRWETPYSALPAPLETTLHRDGTRDRVLFVINPGEACLARISLPGERVLRDAISQERFSGRQMVTLPMEALSVRMLLIEEVEAEGEAQS